MIVHIVRQNEKINDILDNYHITNEDLILSNPHLSDFKKLIPGTKLFIPFISNEISQILDTTEPFVKRNLDDYEESIDSKETINESKKSFYKPGIRYIRPNVRRGYQKLPWFLEKKQ